MGTYTAFRFKVILKEDTPQEVIDKVKRLVAGDYYDIEPPGTKETGGFLVERPQTDFVRHNPFDNYSWDTTPNKRYYYEDTREIYLNEGNIKNYDGDIELFVEFIKPWIEEGIWDDIGSWGEMHYEEQDTPILIPLLITR